MAIGRNMATAAAIAPLLYAVIIQHEADNIAAQEDLLVLTMNKAQVVFDKIEEDSLGRIRQQLDIFRACRLANVSFVSRNNIEALRQEVIIYSAVLPHMIDLQHDLLTELEIFRSIAVQYVAENAVDVNTNQFGLEQNSVLLWEFWRVNNLTLSTWFKFAVQVAVMFTSSGCVERVIALYDSMFSSVQESTLQDKITASVMMKYNENQRNHH